MNLLIIKQPEVSRTLLFHLVFGVSIKMSARCHECLRSAEPGDREGRKHVCVSAHTAAALSVRARVAAFAAVNIFVHDFQRLALFFFLLGLFVCFSDHAHQRCSVVLRCHHYGLCLKDTL